MQPGGPRFDGQHCAKQTLGVLVLWVDKQITHLGLLYHLSGVHDGDPVRELGH